nr:THAP domain-containing protein 5-like [Labrus bergylta]
MLNLRRQNWTPNKASRLCSEHFVSCHIGTDSRGRKCPKNTAVPTIFHFPEEKVPGGKCLVIAVCVFWDITLGSRTLPLGTSHYPSPCTFESHLE